MEFTQQNTAPTPPPAKGKINKLTIVLFVLLILALGAIGYGTYWYLTQPVDTPTTQSQPQNNTESTGQKSAVHFVVSEGYPFGTDLKVTTKLGVPGELQSITESSTIQDIGFNDTLTSQFNDEMGRWAFGTPDVPDPNGSGQIHLIHIADNWLSSANKTGDENNFGGPLGLPTKAMTPTDKKAFLTTLKTDTETCAKDSAKGFVIADFLNVCATPQLITQSVGVYDPVLNIKGFGTSNGRQFIIAGWLTLHDDSQFTDSEADALVARYRKNEIPQETKDSITRKSETLKATTISVAKR